MRQDSGKLIYVVYAYNKHIFLIFYLKMYKTILIVTNTKIHPDSFDLPKFLAKIS